ncbi:MAG: hypothetical protein FD126_1158 [Elusimicrobia bacterium]|nr:MAG: hypothetical protein FD126_1158 [Elusimicrobiota bacterium]
MRKHGKKGTLTSRFGAEIGNRTGRQGVQLAFIADRQFCRWTTEARRAVVIKH